METQEELTERLHELENRLNDLEAGALKRMSLTLEAAFEAFVERGLLPRELIDRFNQAAEPQRNWVGQYADEALEKIAYALLDEVMESLDEEQIPHG